MDKDKFPIIIGLCGRAGTGKTSVANAIVPSHTIKFDHHNGVVWDHSFFAMPLYEMASIKRMTKGEKEEDRILFQLHEVLFDLFGSSPLYGAPPYDEFIKMTKDIAALPMPISDEVKPRAFLQKAGEICREQYENCFTQWAKRKAYQRSATLLSDPDEENETIDRYVCLISDVRYENEGEMIKSLPGGILIRFDASPEVRLERLNKRDGYTMPDSELNHKSEQVELIREEIIDSIIDTDNMSIEQQAEVSLNMIKKEISRIHA
jgi:cytidylate kinase